MNKNELRCFKVSIDGQHWTNINALSRGEAKSRFFRNYDMDIEYTWLRCRSEGLPYTSEDFIRNAKYRNIEFAYCGMKVTVNGCTGFIVGHNSSANLDVLFTDGKYKGMTLNCHPHSGVTYYDKKGNVIPVKTT